MLMLVAAAILTIMNGGQLLYLRIIQHGRCTLLLPHFLLRNNLCVHVHMGKATQANEIAWRA